MQIKATGPPLDNSEREASADLKLNCPQCNIRTMVFMGDVLGYTGHYSEHCVGFVILASSSHCCEVTFYK